MYANSRQTVKLWCNNFKVHKGKGTFFLIRIIYIYISCYLMHLFHEKKKINKQNEVQWTNNPTHTTRTGGCIKLQLHIYHLFLALSISARLRWTIFCFLVFSFVHHKKAKKNFCSFWTLLVCGCMHKNGNYVLKVETHTQQTTTTTTTTTTKKKKLHPESALHLINFFCSFCCAFSCCVYSFLSQIALVIMLWRKFHSSFSSFLSISFHLLFFCAEKSNRLKLGDDRLVVSSIWKLIVLAGDFHFFFKGSTCMNIKIVG